MVLKIQDFVKIVRLEVLYILHIMKKTPSLISISYINVTLLGFYYK